MKIARVFVQEYPGRQVGDIHDLFDVNDHPGVVLSGTLKEVEVDDNFDPSVVRSVIAEDGTITFEADEDKAAEKLQLARNQKLFQLRELRSVKLAEVDLIINDITLQDSVHSIETVKVYRQALKDFTTPYKYVNDPSRAKAAIDGLDLSNISWPTL